MIDSFIITKNSDKNKRFTRDVDLKENIDFFLDHTSLGNSMH